MSNIDRNHEIVGLSIKDVRGMNLGTLYPVLGSDNKTIIGVFSAEFGTPDGYELNERIQAFVEVN